MVPLLQAIVRELVRDFLITFSVYLRKGAAINENKFRNSASGIFLPECSKLTVDWKNGNEVTSFQHDANCQFSFDAVLFLFSFLIYNNFFL